MTSILFVCTANRFRSPLAEAAFRVELEKSDQYSSWSVGSAGTWTDNGMPAMPEAIQAGAVFGLDLTFHRSRSITSNLLKEYTLIVVMQSGQKEALSVEFPDLIRKIFLLSEATGGKLYDIPDPYLTGEPTQEIAREVVDLVRAGWKEICQLASRMEPRFLPDRNGESN